MPLADWVARNVDRAAVERAEREQIARAKAERREFLYGRLFRNISPGRDAAGLRTESEAQELFARAIVVNENRYQVAILRVAVDHRWASVVTAFIKHWDGEHPIADTVKELWSLTLTTGRNPA